MLKKSTLLMILLLVAVVPLKANETLIEILYDNAGWQELLKTDEGIQVNYKKIDGYDLKMLEISQVVDIPPDAIIEVLEDVESYNDVLMGNRNMICNLVEEESETITGYQYYKIPLIRDRYAVFEMKKKYLTPSGDIRSEWILLPQTDHSALSLPDYHYDKSPLSIDTGAGVWMFEDAGDGKWLAIHRLYMNPGGWIPDFIVERVNRKGLAELYNDVMNAASKSDEMAEVLEKQ
jgi:hypothetical protein